MIDLFIELAQTLFKFLENDFSFKIYAIERDKYGAHIIYVNMTTGIKIRFERREGFVFVTLYRLVNGNLPVYKDLAERDGDFTNRFGLDDLILFRSPSSYLEQKYKTDFKCNDLKEVLVYYAKALNIFGKDILQGDFIVFTELNKIVRNRINEYKKKRSKVKQKDK